MKPFLPAADKLLYWSGHEVWEAQDILPQNLLSGLQAHSEFLNKEVAQRPRDEEKGREKAPH